MRTLMIYNGLNKTQAFVQTWQLSEERKLANEEKKVMTKEKCFPVYNQSDEQKRVIVHQQKEKNGQNGQTVNFKYRKCNFKLC